MKKRVLAVAMLLVMVLTMLGGCGKKKYDIKLGVILAGNESSSFYNEFVEAAKTTRVGFELADDFVTVIKDVSLDKLDKALAELEDGGCEIIIAASLTERDGYEKKVVAAAKKNTDTEYYMVGGERGKLEKLDNYSSVYPAQYDSKYLAGLGVGMKLREMQESGTLPQDAKVGYVATASGDEVSAYTAFYLGVNEEQFGLAGVPMEVAYGTDGKSQAAAAQRLIDSGCIVIAQNTDSPEVAAVCADNKVFNVGHGVSTLDEYPDTFLFATGFDWSVFFSTVYGYRDTDTDVEPEWAGSFKYDTVRCFDINTKLAAKDTEIRLDQIKSELLIGSRHVFDTSKFMLDSGKAANADAKTDEKGHLVSCLVDLGGKKPFEAVKNGFFNESSERSYPYFTLAIDGITVLSD